MVIFYVMLFIVAIFSHFELNVGIREESKRKIFLALIFVFYLLSFLRWEYGGDWVGYYTHFEAFTWGHLDEHELIYMVVLLLAKSLINDYTFVLFCYSTILFYCQIKGLLKMSVLPLTSLFVLTGTYFCNVSFVRQDIAVAILFYSLVYVSERRLIPFVVCVMLAFGFHYSALIFLPAYWIYHLRISRKQIVFFIIISIFLSSVMSIFLQGIGDVLGLASITERADKYIDQGYDYDDGSALDPRQTILKACFNRGWIIIIGLYLVGKARMSNFKDSYFSGLFNLYCFGTILFFMASPLHIALTRMSWYFDFTQVLLIPGIFLFINKKQKILIFLFLMVLFTIKTMINHSGDEVYSVYKFIPSIERILN